MQAKAAPMSLNDILGCVESKWRMYLKQRGHYIYKTRNSNRVIISRNSNKAKYRWLLLTGKGSRRVLTKSEQAYIRQHIQQTKVRKETPYLVIGFVQEPRRVVILPAESALKARYVRSDKGGIAWGD
jgi:hypothetical protein